MDERQHSPLQRSVRIRIQPITTMGLGSQLLGLGDQVLYSGLGLKSLTQVLGLERYGLESMSAF